MSSKKKLYGICIMKAATVAVWAEIEDEALKFRARYYRYYGVRV
jgi:hypothetical protein